MSRTIQAPGIELREIDKSEYSKQDYSIVGTTSFICGFSDKGDNYNIHWINTMQNFIDLYGEPKTEYEKYFYNAANEIISRGGILLTSKLPYSNDALNKYTYTDYKIDIDSYLQNTFPEISAVDKSLLKGLVIKDDSTGNMTLSEYDNLKVNNNRLKQNTIRIVDITKNKYDSFNYKKIIDDEYQFISADECIGILPVITTPLNALFYQNIISSQTSSVFCEDTQYYREQTTHLSDYQPILDFKTVRWQDVNDSYSDNSKNYISENFYSPLTSYSINDQTVSKIAVSYFPTISYANKNQIERENLKKIGVVVFQMKLYGTGTNKLIYFQPVESFLGSLNSKEVDETTHKSIFIDDIINSQSRYINFFSNCIQTYFKNIDIIYCVNQICTSLGFYEKQYSKNISYVDSIANALNIILDNAANIHNYNIDLVVDAGVSNIAQIISNNNQVQLKSTSDTLIWKNVIQKFLYFCQNLRKDCMFIADGLKALCLDENSKKIRNSAPQNTIENSILPYIKYFSGFNSSYGAGYCDWFQVYDTYSGDKIWLPPSIKMAGIYIYTDAYFNKWDAPAGISRGQIINSIDCAFSPTSSEAEKIYLQNWNYAVNYPVDGIIAEGQKTLLLNKNSAFSRINVRRLFLYLEKEVSRIAKYFLYEGNTEYIRNRFVDSIKPLFEDAVSKNGIKEYYIKCDNENNTAFTIDNNELHCAIAVKPVKTIEYIVLNFVCTNQSANVSEEIVTK